VTRTLAESDTEAGACGDVPAAVTVIRVPAAFFGIATATRSSTCRPAARTTEQAIAPADDGQTVNRGASPPGSAVMWTLAVPSAFPASETWIA
jgi:hypothetical protein